MKKKLIFCLYTIIILLVCVINFLSIEKFFDKKSEKQDISFSETNNYVINFVSYNVEKPEEVVEPVVEEVVTTVPIVEEPIEEVITQPVNSTSDVNLEIPKAEEKKEEVIVSDILFDGLTEQELIDKLNRSLKNEIAGTGIDFVNYYKETGLDPYLAVAIILHETGCSWSCSNLVKVCFNVGGMKGGPNYYNGTSYTCFASKDEGINAYLNMLYNNYYSKGLNTPELMNPKYAASMTWSAKINDYMNKIRNA